MLRLTARASRGVRRCRARSGNTVTYQRSTLMAVRVAHVACTETWKSQELSVGPASLTTYLTTQVFTNMSWEEQAVAWVEGTQKPGELEGR